MQMLYTYLLKALPLSLVPRDSPAVLQGFNNICRQYEFLGIMRFDTLAYRVGYSCGVCHSAEWAKLTVYVPGTGSNRHLVLLLAKTAQMLPQVS